MRKILDFIITTLIILTLSKFLPGIQVDDWWTAVAIALVLAILNAIVKPLFIILTLPLTIVTFGLFLLFINAFMILLTEVLVDNFTVSSFGTAMLFSIILSICKSLINWIIFKSES